MSSHTCPHCGEQHEVKNVRREMLNKHKLTMLKIAAQHVVETNVNDFKLSELSGDVNNYTNWQKLRYHGLVHHVKKNGVIQRGRWLITRNGWAFLRGELELPKWVDVKENTIRDRAPQTIGVKDVYRGSEAINTTFLYFDDYGTPVGVRPTAVPKQENASLFGDGFDTTLHRSTADSRRGLA